jgi:putative oxidoreductase
MNSRIQTALRLVIGAVLLWAGISKLLQPSAFYSELIAYRVPLPGGVWQLLAATLPWFELICGAALALNVWPETVRPTVLLLFGTFGAMLLEAMIRGLDIRCGCFGSGPGWFESPPVALARAAVLFGAALILMNGEGDGRAGKRLEE